MPPLSKGRNFNLKIKFRQVNANDWLRQGLSEDELGNQSEASSLLNPEEENMLLRAYIPCSTTEDFCFFQVLLKLCKTKAHERHTARFERNAAVSTVPRKRWRRIGSNRYIEFEIWNGRSWDWLSVYQHFPSFI